MFLQTCQVAPADRVLHFAVMGDAGGMRGQLPQGYGLPVVGGDVREIISNGSIQVHLTFLYQPGEHGGRDGLGATTQTKAADGGGGNCQVKSESLRLRSTDYRHASIL